jgi:hypothetical protein
MYSAMRRTVRVVWLYKCEYYYDYSTVQHEFCSADQNELSLRYFLQPDSEYVTEIQ